MKLNKQNHSELEIALNESEALKIEDYALNVTIKKLGDVFLIQGITKEKVGQKRLKTYIGAITYNENMSPEVFLSFGLDPQSTIRLGKTLAQFPEYSIQNAGCFVHELDGTITVSFGNEALKICAAYILALCKQNALIGNEIHC